MDDARTPAPPIQDEYLENVLAFFEESAPTYDLVEEQIYWRLSDELLWSALRPVLDGFPPTLSFLDAGGGTGRWTDRVFRSFPQSRGTLFDLSANMTTRAASKATIRGYEDRLRIVHGDLADVQRTLGAERYDVTFSFHNVLGFVRDPASVIAQLKSLVSPGGALVLVVPNLYHCAFFNLTQINIAEAEKVVTTKRGRFTDHMPPIHLFTPASLQGLLDDSGLRTGLIAGFPVLVYPGSEETRPVGSSATPTRLLGDPDIFRRVFELERSLMGEPDCVGRGNNLLAVAHNDDAGDEG
jgi:SAM-dependent methyltransferase